MAFRKDNKVKNFTKIAIGLASRKKFWNGPVVLY